MQKGKKSKPTKTRQQPPRINLKIIFQNTIKTIKKDKEINTEMKTFQMKTKIIGKPAGEKRGGIHKKSNEESFNRDISITQQRIR